MVFESIKIQEPGKKFLSETNKEVFHEKIQHYLMGKMKNGKSFKRQEFKILCVRFLLEKTNPNSEFDILFFLKVKLYGYITKSLCIHIFDSRKHLLLSTLKSNRWC